uniref:Uncharacterized protein n=1 Tax=Arundo donax TaxID=35708 RepID=A0A0A8ZH95_ARUDO
MFLTSAFSDDHFHGNLAIVCNKFLCALNALLIQCFFHYTFVLKSLTFKWYTSFVQ